MVAASPSPIRREHLFTGHSPRCISDAVSARQGHQDDPEIRALPDGDHSPVAKRQSATDGIITHCPYHRRDAQRCQHCGHQGGNVDRAKGCRRHNVLPISGRAGAAPALEPKEAYSPARSTALAGYVAIAIALASADTSGAPCSWQSPGRSSHRTSESVQIWIAASATTNTNLRRTIPSDLPSS
jgi:hypothetical protein